MEDAQTILKRKERKGMKSMRRMNSCVVWSKGQVPSDMLDKRPNKESVVTCLLGSLEASSKKKRGFGNIENII